jgi:mannose-1-phosphate guanylyltransferase
VGKDTILFITSSDNMTTDEEKYKTCVSRAIESADEYSIVAFTVKPSEHHRGYGYVEFEREEVESDFR